MVDPRDVDLDVIGDFCRRWRIAEFSLFGSVLTDRFNPASDVDILVTLEADTPWSLYEWVDMIDELRHIFGREVDVVERSGLRNPFRRHEILTNRRVVYAA